MKSLLISTSCTDVAPFYSKSKPRTNGLKVIVFLVLASLLQLYFPTRYNMKMEPKSSNSTLQASQEHRKNNETDNTYMLTEMKRLLKENTSLKQENLILKQQIMLSKIEIQNLQLKLEQNTADNHKKVMPAVGNSLQLKLNDRRDNLYEGYSKEKSQILTKPSPESKYIPKQIQNKPQSSSKIQWLRQLTPNHILQATTKKSREQINRPTCKSSRCEPTKRDTEKQVDKSGGEKQISRKQQIMNKYRPFIEMDDTEIVVKEQQQPNK